MTGNLKAWAKTARYRQRRLGAALQYGRSLANSPVLFANSFPKSGTHLLTQVLAGFGSIGPAVNAGYPAVVMYEGSTGRIRPTAWILEELKRLHPGDIGFGHLHGLPEVMEQLCQSGAAVYFILRDPRDVVVSHVHYVTEMEPAHVHHDHYKNTLTNFDDRLAASITGRSEIEIDFPNIVDRFTPYLPWLDCEDVKVLQFERFILDREAALVQVLDHALANGFHLEVSYETALTRLSAAIDPARSPTFRSGKVGRWRESFTDRHLELFKSVGGDNLLVQLGYELSA